MITEVLNSAGYLMLFCCSNLLGEIYPLIHKAMKLTFECEGAYKFFMRNLDQAMVFKSFLIQQGYFFLFCTESFLICFLFLNAWSLTLRHMCFFLHLKHHSGANSVLLCSKRRQLVNCTQ